MSDQAKTAGHWLVVASRFNQSVTDRLLDGALQCLDEAGVAAARVRVLRVPGAWELALAVSRELGLHRSEAPSERPAGVVALGAVVRGQTPHFDYICAEVSRALMEAGLRTGVPVGFGLLTCDDMAQAQARAGGEAGNKGREAARAALDLLATAREA